MTQLSMYLAEKDRSASQTLARRSGVAYATIRQAARGMRLRDYRIAKRISDATGGAVTIADLCDPLPAPGAA